MNIKIRALGHMLLLIGVATIASGGFWGGILLFSRILNGWAVVIFVVLLLGVMLYYIYRDECERLKDVEEVDPKV